MQEQGLKDKTIKGVTWTALDTILRYGVTFVIGIILARLLTPDEYGLIGILTIFIELFNIIIDGGFANALIRKKDAENIDYCTVFYTNLVLSLLMAILLYSCSSLIANFFQREELIALTKVMSSIVIINALTIVQRARLTKQIDFKTQTKVSFFSSVFSGIVGITMAFSGLGVWALVGQQLSNALMTFILLWCLSKWFPKWQFSWESFQDMWSFGWKLLLSGIFNSLSSQIYNVVIGKCFTPATLGQYTRAHHFGSIFSVNFTSIIQRVTFPVLSSIQDEPNRLKSSYKRVIKMTVLPTFILMMGLAACAKPLILTLIGQQWDQASVFLQILCFSMMLYPLNSLNLNAIQVMGRSDLTLRINIIKNLLIIIPVALGILINIYWMLIADVIRGLICYYLNAYYSRYLINYPITEQIKDIMPSFGIAVCIAIPVYLISYLPLPTYVTLAIQLIFGGALAFFICEKIKLPEYIEIKSIVMLSINKIVRRK